MKEQLEKWSRFGFVFRLYSEKRTYGDPPYMFIIRAYPPGYDTCYAYTYGDDYNEAMRKLLYALEHGQFPRAKPWAAETGYRFRRTHEN